MICLLAGGIGTNPSYAILTAPESVVLMVESATRLSPEATTRRKNLRRQMITRAGTENFLSTVVLHQ